MNKKLIAIAVASVMAAPAAMADIKISGIVAAEFTSLDVDGAGLDPQEIGDSGFTRLQIDGTSGDAYARLAYNDTNRGRDTMRDTYVGYKFGGGMTVQAGRMAGAAKNIEKDPYIATFLQQRGTVANSATANIYSSNGFIDDVVQLSMKAGAANVKVQFSPENSDGNGSGPNDAHIGVAVTGKAGGINYFASYNNGQGDVDSPVGTTPSHSNIKLGGSMKFGSAKVTLMYTSMDKDGVSAAGNATDSIFVDGNFDLGNNLSANVGYATRSGDVAADDADFIRAAVLKKLNKGTSVWAGYTTTDFETGGGADTSELGVGMVVKF